MSWISLMAQLGININPYVQGLFRARNEAKTFGKDVGSTLKNSLAGAFGTAAIAGLARKTIEFGGTLTDLKDRLDATTDGLQEWFYAATQTGAGQDDVVKFMETLRDKRDEALEGNEKAIASFRKFGVTIQDLQRLNTDALGKKIGDAVQAGDIDLLGSALKDIGGKSAAKLVPAFKAGLEGMAKEAHEFGQVLDQEAIDKLDALGDKADQLMTRLMAPMATFLGWITTAIEKIETTFKLLGAFSAKLNWSDLMPTGIFSLGNKWMDFSGSKEAQDIVAQSEKVAPKPKQQNEREFKNAEEQKHLEKLAQMRLKLFEDGEKAALKEMTKEQQLLYLTQKRADLMRAAERAKTDEERLRAQSSLVDVQSQLADLNKKDKLGKLSTDGLASVGGYIGRASAGNPAVDIARQQLEVQREIATNTEPRSTAKNYF